MSVIVFLNGCELMDEGGKKILPFDNPKILVNDDAALKSLSVEGYSISPEFDPATVDYTLYVSSAVTSLTVNAIAPDGSSMTATLNGNPLEITDPVALDPSPADNDIAITVVSEDTLTTTVYTLHVYYLSSEAGLSALTVTGDTGMITEAFHAAFDPSEADGTTHHVVLNFLATQVTVSLAPQSTVMTVMVDGWDASNYNYSVPITDLPPTSGDEATRTHTIDVVVYAQDYDAADPTLSTHKITYKIALTMGEAPSNEARLSALKFESLWYLASTVSFAEKNLGFTMDDYMYNYEDAGDWRAYRFTATPVSSEITNFTATCAAYTPTVTDNGDGTYTITHDRGYGNKFSYPFTVSFTITAKDGVTTETYSVTIKN